MKLKVGLASLGLVGLVRGDGVFVSLGGTSFFFSDATSSSYEYQDEDSWVLGSGNATGTVPGINDTVAVVNIDQEVNSSGDIAFVDLVVQNSELRIQNGVVTISEDFGTGLEVSGDKTTKLTLENIIFEGENGFSLQSEICEVYVGTIGAGGVAQGSLQMTNTSWTNTTFDSFSVAYGRKSEVDFAIINATADIDGELKSADMAVGYALGSHMSTTGIVNVVGNLYTSDLEVGYIRNSVSGLESCWRSTLVDGALFVDGDIVSLNEVYNVTDEEIDISCGTIRQCGTFVANPDAELPSKPADCDGFIGTRTCEAHCTVDVTGTIKGAYELKAGYIFQTRHIYDVADVLASGNIVVRGRDDIVDPSGGYADLFAGYQTASGTSDGKITLNSRVVDFYNVNVGTCNYGCDGCLVSNYTYVCDTRGQFRSKGLVNVNETACEESSCEFVLGSVEGMSGTADGFAFVNGDVGYFKNIRIANTRFPHASNETIEGLSFNATGHLEVSDGGTIYTANLTLGENATITLHVHAEIYASIDASNITAAPGSQIVIKEDFAPVPGVPYYVLKSSLSHPANQHSGTVKVVHPMGTVDIVLGQTSSIRLGNNATVAVTPNSITVTLDYPSFPPSPAFRAQPATFATLLIATTLVSQLFFN